MKTFLLEFNVHAPFYSYSQDIKRIEKVIGTKLIQVGTSYSRLRRFELDDTSAIIILKFACDDIILSLKQVEKMDSMFVDDYRVVANIC